LRSVPPRRALRRQFRASSVVTKQRSTSVQGWRSQLVITVLTGVGEPVHCAINRFTKPDQSTRPAALIGGRSRGTGHQQPATSTRTGPAPTRPGHQQPATSTRTGPAPATAPGRRQQDPATSTRTAPRPPGPGRPPATGHQHPHLAGANKTRPPAPGPRPGHPDRAGHQQPATSTRTWPAPTRPGHQHPHRAQATRTGPAPTRPAPRTREQPCRNLAQGVPASPTWHRWPASAKLPSRSRSTAPNA
jgi:hypothetical protein